MLISFWNSVISSPLLSIKWDVWTHGQACCFLGILGGQHLAFLGQRPHSMFLNYPTVGKVCVQKAVSKGLLNGCMNCSHAAPCSIWTHQTLVLVVLHGSEAENSHQGRGQHHYPSLFQRRAIWCPEKPVSERKLVLFQGPWGTYSWFCFKGCYGNSPSCRLTAQHQRIHFCENISCPPTPAQRPDSNIFFLHQNKKYQNFVIEKLPVMGWIVAPSQNRTLNS